MTFFIIFGIDSAKGYLFIAPEAEGGVGGFDCWNNMLGIKHKIAIML